MSVSEPPAAGDVHTHERTFSKADVRRFGEISGDTQAIHTDPDEAGRLIVQGLLTATIPTKIGGDLTCLARSMNIDFLAPVYTGDTITCEWTIDTVEERPDRYDITNSIVCTNQDGDQVLEAEIDGLIRKA